MLGTPGVARAFFNAFLPRELLQRLDPSTIETKPDHFIDPRLGWRETDLLFRVLLDEQEAFVYLLFEHQSTVDRWIVWRSLRNMVLVWEQFLKDDPTANRLPMIIPIVLSHAPQRCWSPMQFQHLD